MEMQFFDQDGTNVRDNKITARLTEKGKMPVWFTFHRNLLENRELFKKYLLKKAKGLVNA